LPGTPLHERTSALCRASNWRRWGGFLAAGSYDLYHDREYWAIRNAAGLIDVSPLYKYLIRGPDAVRFLDRLVTRNVRKCAVGRVMYTPWCDGDGKVIDDGTLARLDEGVFRLTSADPSLLWFHDNAAGMDVSFEDVSERTAALALQGPNARKILQALTSADMDGLRFFGVMDVDLAGIPVSVSRTGYTGDLGYEVWVDAAQAIPLWDALMESGRSYGIVPTGLMALDMARIEAGLVLVTVDYVPTHQALLESQKSTPLELGLAWTVDLDKEHFVGRDALARQAETGPEWRLRGLEIDWVSLEQAYGSAVFGLAHERTRVWRPGPGRLCDQRVLVSAAQEVHRAGPSRGDRRRPRNEPGDGGDRRAPAPAGRRHRRRNAVFRSAAKEGLEWAEKLRMTPS
jgi:aminomethyltransferase